MDKQTKEDIRAIVASEIQDVLRGEMARWWAESVVALSTSRLNTSGNAGVQSPKLSSGWNQQQQRQGGGSGAVVSGGMGGQGGNTPALLWGVAPTSGAAPASGENGQGVGPSEEATGSGPSRQRVQIRQRRAFDAGYLARVAKSLERTQAEISRDQQFCMRRLRTILEDAEETIEQLKEVLRAYRARADHEHSGSRRR